jgi:imidazolonepropionase-like amidohydrolase
MLKSSPARPLGCVLLALPALAFAVAGFCVRAQPPSTVPPDGLRDNTPAVHALVNARLVLAPGRAIEKGTVVVRDGAIVAVGASADVTPPADARVWDLSGRTVYPGLIDAYGELGDGAGRNTGSSSGAAAGGAQPGAGTGPELLRPITGGAAYWNARVTPQFRADQQYRPDRDANKKLRGQGVVARLVAPPRQVIKGTSAAVTTGDGDATRAVLRPQVAMHLQLTPAGTPGTERAYPVSPMGAVALARQALYDAQWYRGATAAWEADTSLPRPEKNEALEALQPVVGGALPLVIDAPDEQYVLRADRLAREFKLSATVRGSGQEYRRLDEIAATGRAIVVPVNFAKPPDVASPESALAYSLEELMDWDLQPENPARLEKAGVDFALTSHGLKDKGEFLKAVRKAVARGLPADAALRSLTVTPARVLGLSRSHGSIEVGKSASFVVADGELFDEKTRVLETWVEGTRYEVVALPKEDVRGTWAVRLGDGEPVSVKLTGEANKPRGRLTTKGAATQPASQPAPQPATKPGWLWAATQPAAKAPGVELANLSFGAAQLAFTFKGDGLGMKGVVQVSATVSDGAWLGVGVRPDGTTFPVTATRTAPYSREEERADREKEQKRREKRGGDKEGEAGGEGDPAAVAAEDQPDGGPTTRPAETEAVASAPKRSEPPPGEREQPTTRTTVPPEAAAQAPATQPVSGALARQAERASTQPALFEVTYPLGAYGRSREPGQPAAVLFRNATVWTSGPRGKLAGASVLVENGKITGVYADGEAVKAVPEGAVVIDCAGKHVSPGIIDCHSHIATDGGINEGSQSITCEVRIADFIDCDDINIYRQLAGGVTAANVLHGSANTIGGQNQVIKLRWGASAEGMKFTEAPPGVKFALGENVKRSNSDAGGRGRGGDARYPASRMGVEQLVRDAFQAAREYHQSWERYDATGKGIPPRRDLELDALWEIVSGRRMIHCHSYRQDEILAFMRACEQFGVTVGVFQHVLEGYKVADQMARHGAAGSSFADWWAYKYEAWDAIPYDGALMRDAGVLVSFNSDDAELARRLNLEAAKAVKYGGVPEEEALKFVTLNPARQLRVDQHVGSIEVGKHADLVVWSGSPLSTLSVCEQTWVDGRKYFDRAEDRETRRRDQGRRNALVQKILGGGEPLGDEEQREPRPRDVWGRHEDCVAGDCGVVWRR